MSKTLYVYNINLKIVENVFTGATYNCFLPPLDNPTDDAAIEINILFINISYNERFIKVIKEHEKRFKFNVNG